MFRLATLAFGLLFSLVCLGCGGSAPGTGAGGDNGTGGGNTVSVTELPVFAVCYQTQQNLRESCNKPLERAAGTPLPIFEWKFEARSCDTNALLHHAETSDFGVFWDGLKVLLPKQGCVNVTNTIDLPRDLNNRPQVWRGATRIEDAQKFDARNNQLVFLLYTDGNW